MDALLNQTDYMYLKTYAIENFTDMLVREKFNRFNNLFDQGEELAIKLGSRKQRALLIDTIFSTGSIPELKMADKSVLY